MAPISVASILPSPIAVETAMVESCASSSTHTTIPAQRLRRARHRLLTDLLDPNDLPALEDACWFTINAGKRNSSLTKSKRISTADPSSTCVDKTPRSVVQELYGLFLAHRILRQVMSRRGRHETDPPRLGSRSAPAPLRILQNHLHEAPLIATWPTWHRRLLEEVRRHYRSRPRRDRWYPRVIKRKMKKWNRKRSCHADPPQPTESL